MPTASQYGLYLRRSYGLEAPIEAALAMTPHLGSLFDLRSRAKAGLIAADLLALGLGAADVTDLPLCGVVGPFEGIAEAIGWMYARDCNAPDLVELREQLRRALPTQLAHAGGYLASYAQGHHDELGSWLDQISGSSSVEERVLAGARAAYQCERDWLGEELHRERTS
ncbi:MAG: hypothetical protein H0X17_19050 [Deltaproteobacteria bacterium]|nr:hypothetical protein [Deltaproteobacteria bacterium]